tara:strand:- start:4332 stop:4529 length:198 start_codon:yes stop_codon:yes gene_type:complete
MSKETRELLDKIVGRLVSRKLLVWGTATALAIIGSVTSEDWVAVSLVYIGSQAAVDLATVWRHGK